MLDIRSRYIQYCVDSLLLRPGHWYKEEPCGMSYPNAFLLIPALSASPLANYFLKLYSPCYHVLAVYTLQTQSNCNLPCTLLCFSFTLHSSIPNGDYRTIGALY